MAWQDQLQKASFRGVEFHVESDDGAFGRRTQLHEYPQRDKPFSEDLGRRAREIGLTAFLVGTDYMAARDKLLSAVEEAGPGTLVHPWYGQMKVTVSDTARVTHSREDGGLCRIQLSFVEAGELAFPSADAAAGSKTLLAADQVQVISTEEFSQDFTIDNLPAWVGEDAVSSAGSMLGDMEAALSSGVLASPVDALTGDLGTLLASPADYASRVFGLFAKGAAILQTSANFADFSSLNFMRAFSAVRAVGLFGNASRSSGLTPARTQLYDNRDALSALNRRALLVQAAGMVASMPLPVYDDAVTLRRDLLSALDAEAAQSNDAAYAALMDLRAQVHKDMTARMRDSARLQVLRLNEVLPALAVAYDLYEDTGREGEIIARNRIRHPGFIPAEPLKVLST